MDLENAVIKMLVRKNRRILEVPLNDRALAGAGKACANVNTFSTIPRPEDSGKISGSD
jgi:hypothetical protein